MEKLLCIKKDTNEKFRYKVEDDEEIFVYAKGRSRYGYRYTKEQFEIIYQPISPKNLEQKRQRKLDLIIKRLEKSGLWSNLLSIFKNMKLYTEIERKRLRNLYWENEEQCKQEMREKYPFMIGKRDDGSEFIITDYIWELSQLKTKSMYFGKWQNKQIKDEIKKALESKTKYYKAVLANYETSFEYKPEFGMAWYSEEYKGCGNGHYYLALDENMAIFTEDD